MNCRAVAERQTFNVNYPDRQEQALSYQRRVGSSKVRVFLLTVRSGKKDWLLVSRDNILSRETLKANLLMIVRSKKQVTEICRTLGPHAAALNQQLQADCVPRTRLAGGQQ
jgi:hypothetical protein